VIGKKYLREDKKSFHFGLDVDRELSSSQLK